MKRLASILALALAAAIGVPTTAQAAFGINNFDVAFTEIDGAPAARAGSHPFAMTVSLDMNTSGDEAEGRLRDLLLDLVPGLVADATYPRCVEADFGLDDCPPVTIVGTTTSTFDEADQSATAPIFNLVPPPGVLLRLGLRIAGAANVFVDFRLADWPPHNLLAEASDFPETIELFGVELELWGDPSSPAHDIPRGGPVTAQPVFLTLPASCEGPVTSFYEAISWEGDEDSGEVLTHDGAGEPMGFHDCGNLGFGLSLLSQLTTSAAKSPSGFEFGLALDDEGLLSPIGLASSPPRELVLVLPEGMSAGSSLTSASGACSQADLEEEALDTPSGGGCPATSAVGTAEVESLLLEEPVAGNIYRATPFANLAEDAPMALYVVLRNVDLGIVVKQPVGLEPDSETGRLIAFAEELPQLPFSLLLVHLDEDEHLLATPARCGDYETRAKVFPWGGDFPTVFVTPVEITSGPNGGPCPADGGALHRGPGPEIKPPQCPPPLGCQLHPRAVVANPVAPKASTACVAKARPAA